MWESRAQLYQIAMGRGKPRKERTTSPKAPGTYLGARTFNSSLKSIRAQMTSGKGSVGPKCLIEQRYQLVRKLLQERAVLCREGGKNDRAEPARPLGGNKKRDLAEALSDLLSSKGADSI